MQSDNRGIVIEGTGPMRVWRRSDVPIATVVETLAAPGDTLKRNRKSLTKRVGDFVVKSSEGAFAIQLIKHTALRQRYRCGWYAALFLEQHDIPAPRPVAHVEWERAGAIWRHATITEYLHDCVDVEHFYDAKVTSGAPRGELAAYLARLATAVNALTASGAVHTDLAGKNILTRNGETFWFIDLDGIVLSGTFRTEDTGGTAGVAFDDTRRFTCHVQLYDSFIDRCDDTLLAPFLEAMLPKDYPRFETWFARVKSAQAVRRARTVAAWKREAKR